MPLFVSFCELSRFLVGFVRAKKVPGIYVFVPHPIFGYVCLCEKPDSSFDKKMLTIGMPPTVKDSTAELHFSSMYVLLLLKLCTVLISKKMCPIFVQLSGTFFSVSAMSHFSSLFPPKVCEQTENHKPITGFLLCCKRFLLFR